MVQAQPMDRGASVGFHPVGFYCAYPYDKKKVVRRLNIDLGTSVWENGDGRWYPILDIAPTVLTLADWKNEHGRRVVTLDRMSLELTENTLLTENNAFSSVAYVCRTGPAADLTEGRKF